MKTEAIAINTGDGVAIMRMVVEAPEEGFSPNAAKAHGFELKDGIYSRVLTDEMIEAEIRFRHSGWKRVQEEELPARSERERWKFDFTLAPPIEKPRVVSEIDTLRAEFEALKASVGQRVR